MTIMHDKEHSNERHRHPRRRTHADRLVSRNALVAGGAEARLDRHQVRAGKLAACQPEQIEQVIMGNVLQAGVGQAPARQAGIGAGIPVGAGAVTVNKVCGSGMKAVMYAANDIRCGEYDVAVAGGMESMSNAPYALPQARSGYRMGNGKMIDVMIHDGLWDPYGDKHMGNCAELVRGEVHVHARGAGRVLARVVPPRAGRGARAASSRRRSPSSRSPGRRGSRSSSTTRSRSPRRSTRWDRSSRRSQKDGGTVTAANSSKINDGAAALVVTSAEYAEKNGLQADGAHRRAGHRGARAGVVHDRAGEGDRHRAAAAPA